MTVIVLGARGMAGHVIATTLAEAGIKVLGTARAAAPGLVALDAQNIDAVRSLLVSTRPHWVVNAVGVLNTAADLNRAEAILVNAYLPHALAAWGQELEFRTIHLSTDCVFSGTRGGYTVTDVPDAHDIYGASKALGELCNARDVTIRTSIVGPELSNLGVGLMLWFLQQRDRCQGWTAARWTGLTTVELARVIAAIVAERVKVTGIYQCVPARAITKYDLLTLMSQVFRSGRIAVEPVAGKATDKSLINDRPQAYAVPDYPKMLTECRAWVACHRNLYANTVFSGS